MVKVKILGITGSPRKGMNTEFLVREALDAAKNTGDVTTEFASLAGKKIEPCIGCEKCHEEDISFKNLCPAITDDAQEIFEKMYEADGIIFASPVYWGGMTAQMKALLDRSTVFCFYSKSKFKGGLRNKIMGAIAVAADRNAGMETTLLDFIHYALMHDMIVVSSGPQRPITAHYGGAAIDRAILEKDELGLVSVRGLGRRVAEVARMIKSRG